MINQTEKIDNMVIESNDQILISKEYPIGGLKGKVLQGANPEYVKITPHALIFIPIFL